jgi:hypothetical protein
MISVVGEASRAIAGRRLVCAIERSHARPLQQVQRVPYMSTATAGYGLQNHSTHQATCNRQRRSNSFVHLFTRLAVAASSATVAVTSYIPSLSTNKHYSRTMSSSSFYSSAPRRRRHDVVVVSVGAVSRHVISIYTLRSPRHQSSSYCRVSIRCCLCFAVATPLPLPLSSIPLPKQGHRLHCCR